MLRNLYLIIFLTLMNDVMPDVSVGTSIDSHDIPEDVLDLAHRLSEKHGRVNITRENSGIHLYMASPICLDTYGESEMHKMHLAVNAEKYLYEGKDLCGQCMKTDTPYKVSFLLGMKSNQQKFYIAPQHRVKVVEQLDNLVDDGKGNMIPKAPGDVLVPVTKLADNHHAIQYIRSRGFEPADLHAQFDLTYCFAERKDGVYRYCGHGFRATPQERLIFYIDVKGVRQGWQARVLDFVDGDRRFYFHPYRRCWVAIEHRTKNGWEEIVPEQRSKKFDVSRYFLAPGAKRNRCLMGYDAAVAKIQQQSTPWIGLTEGPLDAGRIGIPFCAVMGKSFSTNQAELCRYPFVVAALQNDEYSRKLADRIVGQMALKDNRLHVVIVYPPEQFEDFGDMKTDDAKQHVQEQIKEYGLEI